MDQIALGKRIKARRLELKPPIPTAEAFAKALKKRFPKTSVTRQLVNQWESGKHPPPWNRIEQLAVILDVQEDWLVFGGSSPPSSSRFLEYVSEAELALLTAFRKSNPAGQKNMIPMAQTLARENPAPEADIVQLRRGDRSGQ